MNKAQFFNFIKIILSLTFMCFILYYIYGKNPESIKRDLLLVDYNFVILSFVFGAWAYINRGLRWIILIDALGYKTSKINSIAAVSIGYFTNLFIPRAGEISRCASLKKSDNIPVDKLFGTIIIERVIDFAALIIFILLIILLKSSDIIQSYHQYSNIKFPTSNYKIIILTLVVGTGFLIYLLKSKIQNLSFYKKISSFLDGLKTGFESIKNIKNKTAFWLHTFSIWFMYFLMTYICFQAIPETAHLGMSDGLFLLVLGGIGMVIPAPGGFGSYHLLVMIGLIALNITVPNNFLPLTFEKITEGYDEYNAVILFPFIVHTAQTFVAVIMGSLGLWMLAISKKKGYATS